MRTEASLGVLVAANMGVWFLFQGYVISTLGAGRETDAFFAATAIPQLVLLVVNTSLMHVLVPFFAGKSQEETRREAYTLLASLGMGFIALAALLYVTAPFWIGLLFVGFDDASQALTLHLTRIQLISMVCAGLSSVFIAYCHALRRFVIAESAPVIANVIGLAALVVTLSRYGVEAASWCNVLRVVLVLVFLWPLLGRIMKPHWRDAIPVWKKLQPLMASAVYFKSEQVFDRYFLSMSPIGELTLYHFVQQAYSAAGSILSKAFNSPVVPALAAESKKADWRQFSARYKRALFRMLIASAFCMLIGGVVGYFLPAALAGYRGMTETSLTHAYFIAIAMAGVLIGGNCNLVSASGFYAMGDTVVPARTLTITFTLGIFFKIVGFWLWGVIGLAVASSLYCSISAITLNVLLTKRLKINMHASAIARSSSHA